MTKLIKAINEFNEFVSEEGGEGAVEHGATILLWAAAFGVVFMCFQHSFGVIINTIAGHFSKHLHDIASATVKTGM